MSYSITFSLGNELSSYKFTHFHEGLYASAMEKKCVCCISESARSTCQHWGSWLVSGISSELSWLTFIIYYLVLNSIYYMCVCSTCYNSYPLHSPWWFLIFTLFNVTFTWNTNILNYLFAFYLEHLKFSLQLIKIFLTTEW